jgi:hypothetical protein
VFSVFGGGFNCRVEMEVAPTVMASAAAVVRRIFLNIGFLLRFGVSNIGGINCAVTHQSRGRPKRFTEAGVFLN